MRRPAPDGTLALGSERLAKTALLALLGTAVLLLHRRLVKAKVNRSVAAGSPAPPSSPWPAAPCGS
ncbi:hypothetical protein WBG99_06155 [Streptomyces sp. TG1A-60]|uniref:hypothetical protein n=1 Tax=Streptomyces sp. TG1A-60 TaxID=3129111 RepID=UPI0030CC915F